MTPQETAYLSQSSETVFVQPKRSIGGLTMDVVVEETHTDDLAITAHPVEQGAEITDHAYKLPATVTIRAGVSDSGGDEGAARRSVEAYNALLELQGKREPFDLVTGKRVYKNMLIASLAVTTERSTENVLLFTAELKEVILATVQAVTVPRSRQRNGHKTGGVDQRGQVQVEKQEPKEKSAILLLSGN